jgi:hypothetical protein
MGKAPGGDGSAKMLDGTCIAKKRVEVGGMRKLRLLVIGHRVSFLTHLQFNDERSQTPQLKLYCAETYLPLYFSDLSPESA